MEGMRNRIEWSIEPSSMPPEIARIKRPRRSIILRIRRPQLLSEPHPLPEDSRMAPVHSDLPIITPDPPRKSTAEKYGGLYYLGIAGLVVVLGLVGWFGYSFWTLRGYFGEVFILHDPARSEVDRVNAALLLSRSSHANQREFWDDALNKNLPPLARYLMAESLTSEATDADPHAYALAVAKSEGWPDWLRLLLVRPMALASDLGRTFPADSLEELRRHADPAIRLWTAYVQAAGPKGQESARSYLHEQANAAGPYRGLASLLSEALQAELPRRVGLLDQATRWLREHHPGAAQVWTGWELREDRLVQTEKR
jgi:hypothetical protein